MDWQLRIGPDRLLEPGSPTLIVAEIGQNHNGDVALAEQLIDAASWAGADAVKVVKRDLECELSRQARCRPYESPNAFGITYGAHRRALELSAQQHQRLARRARQRGLVYLATACDCPSVDLMVALGVDGLKIASRDAANLPLVHYVARQGRPVILSTGMSDLAEIDAAVEVLRSHDAPLAVLQCTSLYPAPRDQAHLRSMATLAHRYGVPVGYSDHTPGTLLAPVAVGMGAAIIEKHLTLDRGLKGTDHACSLEPHEFQQMVAAIRDVKAALGRDDKPVPAAVRNVRAKLGRSLVTRVELEPGTCINEGMLTLKCPGDGLSWHQRHLIVGRRAKRRLKPDELVSINDVI